MATGEFAFIRWLRDRTPADPRVRIGPGDDCAALAPPAGDLLVTTDLLTDGVDFLLADAGPRRVGRKAMAVNLSDIAAMAGRPLGAVVAVALPAGTADGRELAEELFLGLRDIADRYDTPIVGGDTNSWPGKLVVCVTVFGEAPARGPVRRSGARPGDWLFVTGPVGGSLLGRHLEPTPRLREAAKLYDFADLHAMIDVSDGLAADLNHILEESGCGAVVSAADVPIHPDAVERAKRTGRPPLAHALGDGEDFELIFAVSPADGERLEREPPVPGLVKFGECVEEGLWLDDATGALSDPSRGRSGPPGRHPLEPTGWVHGV